MLGAQRGDAIVRFRGGRSARIGLHDGRIDLALVHAAEHIFFCAEQAEHATFAQVGMRINSLGHESSPWVF
jgi:hypothetical protein